MFFIALYIGIPLPHSYVSVVEVFVDDLSNGQYVNTTVSTTSTLSMIATQSLYIVSACSSTTPSPILLSARISDYLGTIDLVFDRAVRSSQQQSQQCGFIVDVATVGALGAKATCFWTSTTTAVLILTPVHSYPCRYL